MSRPVAIIDIDTTIANNEHRAHLLKRVCVECKTPMQGERGQDKWPVCQCGGKKYAAPQGAWDQFLQPELMRLDEPVPHALPVIDSFREQGWYIYYLTGRNEKHRDVTEEWLHKHMDRTIDEPLIMRPISDTGTPASVMKEKLFLGFSKPHRFAGSHFFFFEDDRYVLGMWKKYGTVFLCPQAWETMNPTTFDTNVEPAWNR
jgi:hypothetical protein